MESFWENISKFSKNKALVAIETHDKSLTFENLTIEIDKTVDRLKIIKLKKHAKVLIIGFSNSIETVIQMLSLLKLKIVGSIIEPSEAGMLSDTEINSFNYIIYPELIFLKFKLSSKKKKFTEYHNIVEVNKSTIPLPESAVWMFFTSGSTGRRKLIVVSNESFIHRLNTEKDLLKLETNSISLGILNLSHELGFYQICSSLFSGGKTYKANCISSMDFLNKLITQKITHVVSVPGVWEKIIKNNHHLKINEALNLRYVTLSGASLNINDIENLKIHLSNKVTLIKTYGQTETSRTLYEIVSDLSGFDSFTQIIDGVEIKLNENGELIHIGNGSMLGEINLLSGEFIPNKRTSAGFLQVKTGDIFENIQGSYIFKGRIDDVVKIHGHRISLLELENLIKKISGINNIVLVYSRELCCFFEGSILSEIELKNLLMKRMPQYGVPSRIKKLEHFPILGSGKIDREKIKERNT